MINGDHLLNNHLIIFVTTAGTSSTYNSQIFYIITHQYPPRHPATDYSRMSKYCKDSTHSSAVYPCWVLRPCCQRPFKFPLELVEQRDTNNRGKAGYYKQQVRWTKIVTIYRARALGVKGRVPLKDRALCFLLFYFTPVICILNIIKYSPMSNYMLKA